MARWTHETVSAAIEAHADVRYAAEDRICEIDLEMRALKAERARLENLCDRHERAQYRLVDVRLGLRKRAA